jgi:hypothetical protein
VKDDLVEGLKMMPTDELERQEMMAVQLDEARGFLIRDTVAHARLAFILLDNAAEVMMRRNVEAALSGNKFLEQIRDRWQEILAEHPDDTDARRQHDEVNSQVVSKRTRKGLAEKFDAKVDFIRDGGEIEETEARVLKKLHKYRNELYHRDHIRPQMIRSACLLYFDLACTLFERLRQSDFSIVTFHMQAPPALRKFSPPETVAYPDASQIAAVLRSELGIDDTGLRTAIITHLTTRLDALEATLAQIQDMLFGGLPELAPSGPWRKAAIHAAQWPGKEPPGSFDELLDTKFQYEEADLTLWRQQAESLHEASDKLGLFAAFADTEDAFEPFEEQVMALEMDIDRDIQREVDMRRGK